MFRCAKCEQVSELGESPVLVVVKKREKIYPGGRRGFETVKEVRVHAMCAAIVQVEVIAAEGSLYEYPV